MDEYVLNKPFQMELVNPEDKDLADTIYAFPFDSEFRKIGLGGDEGFNLANIEIAEEVLHNPEYYCPSYKKLYAGVPDKTVNFAEYKHDLVIVNKQNNYTVLLQAAFSRIEAATSWFVRHDINENLVLTLDRKDEIFYIEPMQPDLRVSLDRQGREVPTDEADTVTYLIEKHENAIMVYGE